MKPNPPSRDGIADLQSSRPSLKDESSPTIYRTRGHVALFLPLHLVGLVTVAEAEGAGEVAAQELLLLDAAEDGLVDGLLVGSTGGGNNLLLLRVKHRLA